MNQLKFLVAALSLNAGTAFAAGDTAVEDTNYQIGYASGDMRFKDGGGIDTNAYGISGRVTLPLAAYLGASVEAAYLRTNLSSDAVTSQSGTSGQPPECAYNTGEATATFFVRNPSFGRIGVGYGKNRTKSRCDAEFAGVDAGNQTTTSTSGTVEIYLGDFTLGATRTRSQANDVADVNGSSVVVTWYPTPNLRTALSGDGLDSRDTYHFQLEHQPEIFDNTTGLLLEYWTRRTEPETYYIGVGIRYYFNERVELKTRDRAYR